MGRSYVVSAYAYPGRPAVGTVLYAGNGMAVRQQGVSLNGEGASTMQQGSGEQARFQYDGLSRLRQLTDGNGRTFQHVYDNVGNLRQVINKNSQMQADYDAEGNVAHTLDEQDRDTWYTRAPDDSRVTDVQYGQNALPSVHYEYDAFGRVKSAQDSRLTLSYTYDCLGNVLTATTKYAAMPYVFTLEYDYYPDGHRKSLRHTNGRQYPVLV